MPASPKLPRRTSSGGQSAMGRVLSMLLPSHAELDTTFSIRNGRQRNWVLKCSCLLAVLLWLLNFFGLLDMMLFEIPFRNFRWPPFINVSAEVLRMKQGLITDHVFYNQWAFHKLNIPEICSNTSVKAVANRIGPLVLFVVKSAAYHFKLRSAVRDTWGGKNAKRVNAQSVFLVGMSSEALVNEAVNKEASSHHDILQGNFLDTYRNNTLKMLMGMQWLVDYCSQFDYVMFVDDDFHVHNQNLFSFLRLCSAENNPQKSHFYSGFRFDSIPFRIRAHKHYISLQEYPFSRYPPYIAAGAYVLSRKTLQDFYYASHFVKQYPYDDVYLGIVAKLLDVHPQHNDKFEFWTRAYDKESFVEVIAAHGFDSDKKRKAFTDFNAS